MTSRQTCAEGSPTGGLQAALKQFAQRTELHQIETLTVSDRQFLTGNSNDAQMVTIAGELRIAQGSGRSPLIVLQHGSGGCGANIELWSRHLNGLGISTFALDGFTGRGLTEVNTNQAMLGRLNLIVDIYRALEVLVPHPSIDVGRIGLMGFSRGGQAALYASLNRFHRMWNRSGADFACYLAFYPDCSITFMSDTEVMDRPIRIFGGTLDDYNPISTCKKYVERLRASGADVELLEYVNASHAFDNPLGPRPAAVCSEFQSVRRCSIREEAGGLLVDAETSQPFTYQSARVAYGAHTGYDPVATRASEAAVTAFLATVFRL
jgi:dienelactone hydrolase